MNNIHMHVHIQYLYLIKNTMSLNISVVDVVVLEELLQSLSDVCRKLLDGHRHDLLFTLAVEHRAPKNDGEESREKRRTSLF